MNDLNLTSDEIKLTLTYFIEYMLASAILPGQVENWIIITDMDGVGVTNVPYSVKLIGLLLDPQGGLWLPTKQLQSQIVQRLHSQRALDFQHDMESCFCVRRGDYLPENQRQQ